MGFINLSWRPEWQSPGRSIPVCTSRSMIGHVGHNGFSKNRDDQIQNPTGCCMLLVRNVALRTNDSSPRSTNCQHRTHSILPDATSLNGMPQLGREASGTNTTWLTTMGN